MGEREFGWVFVKGMIALALLDLRVTFLIIMNVLLGSYGPSPKYISIYYV